MKRLNLLLASTAIPMTLLVTPDLSTRALAQSAPVTIQISQEQAGLDAEALDVLAQRVREARQRAEDMRQRAEDLTERAEALAVEAEAAEEEAEALAAASDPDPSAIQAAEAEAQDMARAAQEAAETAAGARADAEAAEEEAEALRNRLETAEREAREMQERAAEREAEAEIEADAETEEEAAIEPDRILEEEVEAVDDEAAAPIDIMAEDNVEEESVEDIETEAASGTDIEVEAEVEGETQAEREAESERETRTQADAEPQVAPERERRHRERALDEPVEAPTAEAVPEEVLPEEEPERFEQVRERRRSRVERGVTITEEPGARTILQEGDQLIIRQAEEERVRRTYSDVRRERRGDEEVLVAPREGNVEIVTILDTEGNLLRRIRREADGTETVLIDNTRRERGERDRRGERREETRRDRRDERGRERRGDRREGAYFGLDGGVFSFRIDIPPPVIRVPRERYVVDYGDLYEEDLEDIFSAPPVAEIRDRYTLDEVRYNPNLRDYMARVDLDTVTFDTGSWSLSPGQIDRLGRAARAMNRVIDRNPNEIFLIEGHTDAVGRAIDNLSLSDRRAESVAYILTRFYDVPPENLVTQGYGEEFLKIDTQAAERRNRRVTIRRITPLIVQGPRG